MNSNCLDLTDRVAVVFGASSGLGKEIALGLAQHGAHVVPTGRRIELVTAVSQQIQAQGRGSFAQAADVRDRQSIRSIRDRALDHFGRIDILVNASGTTFRRATNEIGDEEWNSLFHTNLTGVLHSCQEFYKPLKESSHGRVITIASLGSFVAFHEVAAYCASKAALLSLTRSLACEWARDRICVNAIAPGVFPTELNSNLLQGTERGREILQRTPMHRFGDARELIGAAVLLASDGASFITGECLVVDGGYMASGVNS